MKIILALLGGVLIGVVGVVLWLMWYFRDIMR